MARGLYKFWLVAGSHIFTLLFWIVTVVVLAARHSHCHYGHDYKRGYYYKRYCHNYKRYEKDGDSIWAVTIALSAVDG
jgi:hypothetical protein